MAGDLLCQTIEKKKGEDYDLKRCAFSIFESTPPYAAALLGVHREELC